MPVKKVNVRVEYRDFGLRHIMHEVEQAKLTKIRVGVVGPRASQRTSDGKLTNAENGAVQMFGLGNAPPRDFLNAPFARARGRVADIMRNIMGRVIRGATAEDSADDAGYELQKIARDAIDGPPHIPPPNRPSTVAKKGFNHPLVETGDLREAISHRVVREGGGVLEAGAGDYDTFEIGDD